MDNRPVKISCSSLWKIYGPHEHLFFEDIKNDGTTDRIGEHVQAVKDVSFDVFDGELFVIMGLSGSGKSTLARCINGLVRPTRGKVAVDGLDLSTMDDKQLVQVRRKKVSMVFQHFSLFPHKTVLENVVFGLEVRGEMKRAYRERGMEMLNRVGLCGWEHSYPKELSGGMQQRVGLARALAPDPEVLVMDEPFSALDPLIRRQMHEEFIRIMSTTKKTIVFITHDLNEAVKLGSRIAIMKDGEIKQIGTPEEIVCAPCDGYVESFVRDLNRENFIPVGKIMKKPEMTISESQCVEEMLDSMREGGKKQAFLIDGDGRLLGRLDVEELGAIPKKKGPHLNRGSVKSAPKISPDQPIGSLIPLVAEYDCTIAVVDENDKLIGEVTRTQLLKTIQWNPN
ncbi:betaine/proline/choline family ABC transporter ATP-binding protein [uncultured Desulfosarcina sp.]|uniref:quaternary amine ABC transporter ATP-binding protein n=1 Tax=uncultured Desulfosarcina sp. TaxID=218289 RepID=UPI0029C945F3|nr:betaine/proline/choline family ABC transporter ATP-binding protein [uncultured Desulfosarcina sp.]